MSARRIIVELRDAAGAPVAGAKVKATDCWELESTDSGLAVFLVDVPEFSIAVEGVDAYHGTLDSAPEKIVLAQSANGWRAQ